MVIDSEVLTIGETMALVVPDPLARLIDAATFGMGVAGGESNVAQWLAALGHDVRWASRLGADPLGERVRAEVERWGVRVDAVTDTQRPTGLMVKDSAPTGSSVHYYRAGSAASHMTSAWLDGLGARPRLVHTTGVTAALSADCCAMVAGLNRSFPDAIVSFDVNHRPKLWSAADAAPVLHTLGRQADLLFVGRDEAEGLWGTRTAADVRDLFAGVDHVIVKDAEVGAWEFHADRAEFVPSPPIEVVEPIGAGDAFAAGFLSGWLKGWPAERRLALGHRLAGLALGSNRDVPEVALDTVGDPTFTDPTVTDPGGTR